MINYLLKEENLSSNGRKRVEFTLLLLQLNLRLKRKKTYQQEQYNELHPRPKSRYEQFQEWLNECPVEIANYLDYTDTFEVTFKVPLENVAESITKEQLKSIKGNLL